MTKTIALKGLVSILLLLCQFEVNNGVEVKCLSNSTDTCEVHEPINGNDESLTVLTTPEQHNTIVAVRLLHLTESIPNVVFQRFPETKFAEFRPDVKSISQINFKEAKKLFYLKLDGNHVKVVPKEVFASATTLHTVDFSSNTITDVEDYAFSGATDLKCVILSKNSLTIIRKDTFSGAPKLTRIELEENQIETVEEGAFDIASLKELFFESNRMKQVHDNIFRNSPNLEIAYFCKNGMTEIGQAFYNLKSLRSVSFRHSQLKDVDLYAFVKSNPNLENVYLESSGFQFPNIPRKGEVFENKLQNLYLTNNSISNSNVLEHLEAFTHLQYLDIAFNNINQIDGMETIKQKYPEFESLLYPGNPLKCSWVESTQFDRNLFFVPVYHEFNIADYSEVDGIYCKK